MAEDEALIIARARAKAKQNQRLAKDKVTGVDLLGLAKDVAPSLAVGVGAGALTAKQALKKRVPQVGILEAGAGAVKQLGQQAEALTGKDIPFVRGEEAPKTSKEAAMRILPELLMGMGGEIGGAGGVALATKMFGKSRKYIPSVTPQGKEALRELGEEVTLTPAQVSKNRAINIGENVAEASFFGGGKITRTKADTKKFVTTQIKDFARKFRVGKTKEELGTVIRHAIDGQQDEFLAEAENMYKVVDELIPEKFIKVSEEVPSKILGPGGKPLAKKVSKRVKVKQVDYSGLQKEASKLSDKDLDGLGAAQTLLKKIVKKDQIGDSFKAAQKLRSDLAKVTRSATEIIPGENIGIAKDLIKVLDDAMEVAAVQLSPEGLQAWRQADEFWKTGKELFNKEILKRVASEDADIVADAVKEVKNAVGIKRIKDLIDNPTIWKDVQSRYIDDIIKTSTDVDKVIDGTKILEQIKGLGEERVKAVFPEGELNDIKKLARILRISEDIGVAGTGTVAIQLMQTGALAGVLGAGGAFALGQGEVGAGVGAGSVAILATPAALSFLFTNRTARNLILKGSKKIRVAKSAAKIIGRLNALMAMEEGKRRVGESPEVQSFLSNLKGGGPTPRSVGAKPTSTLLQGLK